MGEVADEIAVAYSGLNLFRDRIGQDAVTPERILWDLADALIEHAPNEALRLCRAYGTAHIWRTQTILAPIFEQRCSLHPERRLQERRVVT